MPVSTISKIESLDREFQDLVCSFSSVPSGSILRVHNYSYLNWGIQITPRNVEWLYHKSCEAYSCEWKDTDESLNKLVGQASKEAGLGDVNANMNYVIGAYGADMIEEIMRRKHNFVMIDVGAGAGPTTDAVLRHVLCRRIPLNGEVILIEPSRTRLETARSRLAETLHGTDGIKVTTKEGTDVSALGEIESESVDLVVSNAAIHHNAFNTHLSEISRVLRPGAPFINGDWHTNMWEHPARVYWLLSLLQNPRDTELQKIIFGFVLGAGIGEETIRHSKELVQFMHMFSLSKDDVLSAFNGLTYSERMANVGIMLFWLKVNEKFAASGMKAPIFFLESHERVSNRVQHLTDAKFVFDKECRSKYQELLRKGKYGIKMNLDDIPNSAKGELSAVMVAKKRKA